MASNADTAVARRFHDATSHTPYSVRTSGHVLDWDVKPLPFKIYVDRPVVALPREIEPLGPATLDVLAGAAGRAEEPMTLARLAALLYYTAGVTKKKAYPGDVEVFFRAAPSTGALYQTEVYVVAGAVAGLDAGLYHFCPGDFALRRLRDGDVRGVLAEAVADETVARRAASIVLSAIPWRNTWKYQARGWRHLYWDSGTMLANLLAVADVLGWRPNVFAGFVDSALEHLLGLDDGREMGLEVVTLGAEGGAAPSRPVAAIRYETVPLSSSEVDEPALREVQEASSLEDAGAVRRWRAAIAPARGDGGGRLHGLPEAREGGAALGTTIDRRASTRCFSHAPLTAVELATALSAASRPFDADVPAGLVDLYLIVNAVEEVPAGAFRYRPDAHALEVLREGDFRRESAFLCLEQALGGDAAAVIYFLAPVDELLRAWGNRGLRLANLEAGLAGGRAYLAAYAQGFGASGLTFYDADVVRFFSPHAAGKDAIFVTALGRPARARGDAA